MTKLEKNVHRLLDANERVIRDEDYGHGIMMDVISAAWLRNDLEIQEFWFRWQVDLDRYEREVMRSGRISGIMDAMRDTVEHAMDVISDEWRMKREKQR